MAEEKVKLSFEADVKNFEAEVRKIPGITDAAVKKMTANYARGIKKTDKINEDALKSIKENAKNVFGGIVGDIEDVTEGLGQKGLAGSVAAASGAFLAGAAAVGAVSAAFDFSIGVASSFAASLDDAARNADKLAPKLNAIAGQPIVTAESLAAANQYEAQVGTLDTVTSGFSQVLVDEYAPAMRTAAEVTTKLGLDALDTYKNFQKWADESGPFAIVGRLAELTGVSDVIADIATEGRVATIVAESQARSAAAVDEAHQKAAKDGIKKYNDALKDTIKTSDEAADAWSDHVEKINDLIEKASQDSLRAREADAYALMDAEIEAHQNVLDMFTEADERYREEKYQAEIKAADELEELQKEGAERIKALASEFANEALDLGTQLAEQAQQRHEDEIGRLDEVIAKREENLKKAIAAGNKERAAQIRGNIEADKATRELEKTKAKRAYAVQQAMALTGIAISTGQATMALLASPAIAALGPGAPAAAAGIAIGTGAVQAAAVLAAPPPKYHGGYTGDEVPATVTKKEAVLNSRAAARLGRDGINALNAGADMGGGSWSFSLAIDGRQAAQMTQVGVKNSAFGVLAKRDPLGAGHYARNR